MNLGLTRGIQATQYKIVFSYNSDYYKCCDVGGGVIANPFIFIRRIIFFLFDKTKHKLDFSPILYSNKIKLPFQ